MNKSLEYMGRVHWIYFADSIGSVPIGRVPIGYLSVEEMFGVVGEDGTSLR